MQVGLKQLFVQTTHAQQFNDMVDNMVQHVDTFSKDQLLKDMLDALTDIAWGNVDVVVDDSNFGDSSTNSSGSDSSFGDSSTNSSGSDSNFGDSSTNSSGSDQILSVPGERFYECDTWKKRRQVLGIKSSRPEYYWDTWEYGEWGDDYSIWSNDVFGEYVYSRDMMVRGTLYKPRWT